MTPNNPTPDAMVLVPLYYMRDNHTFRRLSDNPTVALAEVMEEFDAGWSHGMLCTKRPGEAGTLHVHASGSGRKSEFEADAAAWLERQRVLAAPPPEPAEPKIGSSGGEDQQWCNTHGVAHSVELRDPDCEFPNAEPSVPADGVTEQMVNAACAAHDPIGWRIACGETTSDMRCRMRDALTAALAPLLDDRDQWRNTAQLAENERRSWQSRAETAEAWRFDVCERLGLCCAAGAEWTTEDVWRCVHDEYMKVASAKEAAERDAREARSETSAWVAQAQKQADDARALRGRLGNMVNRWDAEPGPFPAGWTVSLHAKELRAELTTPSGAPDSGEALDARRYRWLRTAPNENVSLPCVYAYRDKVRACVGGKQLDAAIDAAIAASTEGEMS
jgi:hypothetical protein